ncbi:type II toxin-antitoxin system HipA family toxin [Rhodoferax sp.]|uniref:type II toxin-antitoxin system HipA family toxin n=1 Tax=Rhodoferax sp. TaxID=50421 RepID=UPI001A1012E5|nr:type II toxin-antitoxin system HipA family toxin [Rhodoferax sp.]MBE0475026.1 type II toxin-antitoxin system HipA family toxin [Rhodoferax sp.]
MKKVFVYYEGWGERWLLGTLADNGSQLLFEYSKEALAQQLELSPLRLRLAAQAYGNFPTYLQRLPGLVSDSLPDGWGLLLMDKLFRKAGRNPATLSPLDRLAFVGSRGMGALTFEPADRQELGTEDFTLLDLAREVQVLVSGEESQALKQLALMGGSPHGARPKVLVFYNAATHAISTQATAGSAPWLVKFHAQDEHKEACAIEHLYARLARACQLNMPQTAYFDLDKKLAAFGIERFDVQDGMRVPVHTLAGALHADFRSAGAVDYATFMRLVRLFTRNDQAVQQAYERCVFNVLFHNRDDHAKNFSFRLNKVRQWELAPCYDLSFNAGPGGEHQMDVLGHGKNITRALLLALAEKSSLDKTWATSAIARMLDVHARLNEVISESGMQKYIRPATLKLVRTAIAVNARLLS